MQGVLQTQKGSPLAQVKISGKSMLVEPNGKLRSSTSDFAPLLIQYLNEIKSLTQLNRVEGENLFPKCE